MTTPPSNTPPSDSSSGSNYIPQYHVDMKEWRTFFEKGFPGTVLTDSDIQKMADNFIKFFSDSMNQVLNHAVQVQKENDKKWLEEQGG